MEYPKCVACGRELKSAESRELGMGPTCARRARERETKLEALTGPPSARLLFPETDQPAIDAALDEVIK